MEKKKKTIHMIKLTCSSKHKRKRVAQTEICLDSIDKILRDTQSVNISKMINILFE